MPKFDYNKPNRPKAIWTQLTKKKPVASKVKRISKVSVKRAEQLKEYSKLRKEFLRRHPACQGLLIFTTNKCLNFSRDIHHLRGRSGALLCDIRFWKALCRQCHIDVGNNPKWARSVGLLCAKGEWNQVPK